ETLVIESAEYDDGGHCTCVASNAAGDVDKIIRLSVIALVFDMREFSFTKFKLLMLLAPPYMPDQHTIVTETVIAGQPFSLLFSIFSSIAAGNAHVELTFLMFIVADILVPFKYF
uniref:Ig-like domain-containing protein n=1 Tax=Ascaris lumbricoides TaxID=6252 RepID=A0A0M3IW87_ASCLU